MYNMVYLKFPKRVRDLKNYHNTHIDLQRRSCEVRMCSLMAVILSQCIHMANHTVHFKYIQLYLSSVPQ